MSTLQLELSGVFLKIEQLELLSLQHNHDRQVSVATFNLKASYYKKKKNTLRRDIRVSVESVSVKHIILKRQDTNHISFCKIFSPHSLRTAEMNTLSHIVIPFKIKVCL